MKPSKWHIPEDMITPEPPDIGSFMACFVRRTLLKQGEYLELLAGAFYKVCGDVDPRRIVLVKQDDFNGSRFWYELRPEEEGTDDQAN
ncbi:MAG: hypothetical protein ABIL58_27750 [Pseudomonadota bacterium]